MAAGPARGLPSEKSRGRGRRTAPQRATEAPNGGGVEPAPQKGAALERGDRKRKGGTMNKHVKALGGAGLLLGVSTIAAAGADGRADDAARSAEIRRAGQDPNFVERIDIQEYKALPAYHEPDWVTKQFVDTGKLPPVEERLPKEPLVFKTAQHARRHRRLRRRDAPRHRRPAGGLELAAPARSRAGAASTSACASA